MKKEIKGNLKKNGQILKWFWKNNLKESFKITDPMVKMAFSFFKQTFIRDDEKYKEKVCY